MLMLSWEQIVWNSSIGDGTDGDDWYHDDDGDQDRGN